MAINQQSIADAVKEAIERAITAEREEAIALAVARFDKGIRERMAVAVLEINRMYSMAREGSDLVIRVKIDEPKVRPAQG